MYTILFTALSALAVISASPLPHSLDKRVTGARIRSNRSGLCLQPVGGKWGSGTQVGLTNCNDATRWDISRGSGSVFLSGLNDALALDAGTGRDNNEIVKLWQSYPTLFQQTWYYTDDDRIAITGGDQCLDEGDGNTVQTYQCTTGNTNQIWTLLTDVPEPTLIISSSGPAKSTEPTLIVSSSGPAKSAEPTLIVSSSGPAESAEPTLIVSSSGPAKSAEPTLIVSSSGPAKSAEPTLIVSSSGPAKSEVVVSSSVGPNPTESA